MTNHFANTPEALLGRNDSKNPSTTCKGITSSGRPCRRALASAKTSLAGSRRSSASGVVAVVEEDGAVTDAQFFCWQHKDQAQELQHGSPSERSQKKRTTELYALQEKGSIDTLVQKLGINAVPDNNIRRQAKVGRGDGRAASGARYSEKRSSRPPPRRREPARKKAGLWASLCCASQQEDDEYVEIVRHKKRAEHSPQAAPGAYPSSASLPPPARRPGPGSRSVTPAQRSTSHPHIGRLLALIPQDLSPQTTSALLAELIKPLSPADEAGYIYIFWLTPQSRSAPGESTARSLLSSPADRPQNTRRISDVMTEFSYDGAEETPRRFNPARGKKTIMLKIGRANNVTRRMNEWQRQCGYALNLVRWYPYMPSTPASSPLHSPRKPTPSAAYPDQSRPHASRADSAVVHKVPSVKRVERLIHLELAELQVKQRCEACGKEHREWFAVEASEQGVRNVDACVKRWVEWAEEEAVR